jgi:hypothetical protein
MKRSYIFAIIATASLCACTTKLNQQDAALLRETNSLARQAASQSAMALAEAKAARDSAERAAYDAQASGKKADRIFRASQQK